MKPSKFVTILAVTCILDVVITTVTFCKGNKFYDTLSHALTGYSFTNSVFELWLLVIVRNSVIIGSVIGVCFGREIGLSRIRSKNTLILSLSGLQCMFTLIKLLCVSERVEFIHNLWFWLLFSWTLVSSVLLYIEWAIFGRVKFSRTTRGLNINNPESKEEHEPLLNGAAKRDEDNGSGNFLLTIYCKIRDLFLLLFVTPIPCEF